MARSLYNPSRTMKQTSITTSCGLAAFLFCSANAVAQIPFNPGSTVPTGQRPDAVAFGDFDLDGDQDLAVTTGPQGTGGLDRIEIYNNNGAFNFSLAYSILVPNAGPGGLVARDFDNNGQMDLAVALHNSSSVAMLMNAGGVLQNTGSTGVGFDPRSLGAGDVDGDGDTDVVSSNRDGNSVSVLLNNGTGTMSLAGTTSVGSDLRGVVVADFNGDNLDDVAVSSHDSRQVAVLMSTGGGALGAPTLLSVGAGRRPEGLTAADLNGDGQVDLAAATSLNNDSWATVFINAGGSFGFPQHFAFLGVDAGPIVAADFDLDGDADLATANQDSNDVSILQNSGTGFFGSPTSVSTGVSPDGLAAGDLDGDGDADLATANQDSNNVSVLMNPGAGNAWSNFCQTSANSAGAGAIMDASGSSSVNANTFTLEVTGAVPSSTGMFFYGSGQTQQPLGNGWLCIPAPLFRLGPPTASSATGSNSRLLDFTQGNPSMGAGQILPGSSWNFQYWYRDVAGGGAQFNFSDGLNVSFIQ